MNKKFINFDCFNEKRKNYIKNCINEDNINEVIDLYNSREENENKDDEYFYLNLLKIIAYYSINPDAAITVGNIYSKGYVNFKSIQLDVEQAIYFYKIAVSHNSVEACEQLVCIYSSDEPLSNNIDKVISYAEKAVSLGSKWAVNILAGLFLENEYKPKDISLFIEKLKSIEDSDFEFVLIVLSRMYKEGKYLEKNIDKSIRLLKHAIELNSSAAMHELGYLYLEMDLSHKALEYFYMAAELKNPASIDTLTDAFFIDGNDPYNHEKSIALLEKGAKENSLLAINFLCEHYINEEYNPSDSEIFYKQVLIGAENNIGASLAVLGFLEAAGIHDDPDMEKVTYYFEKAMDLKHVKTIEMICELFLEQKYEPTNLTNFVENVKYGADNEFRFSTITLAHLYEHGIGVEKSIEKRDELFKKLDTMNEVK